MIKDDLVTLVVPEDVQGEPAFFGKSLGAVIVYFFLQHVRVFLEFVL